MMVIVIVMTVKCNERVQVHDCRLCSLSRLREKGEMRREKRLIGKLYIINVCF